MSEAERAHLRHMTDGHWHDDCRWCRIRRIYGGTGLEPASDEKYAGRRSR